MERKIVVVTMLTLLLASVLTVAFNVQPFSVKASLREESGQARGVDSFARAGSTNLTSSIPIRELSWTQGEPFPVINGRVMFPALPPSELTPPSWNAHWYAGSVYPWSLASQNARTISMSITVPSSAPRPDEFYYVILSAFDNNGSYDQIGFSDTWGTWGLTYSWTSGPIANLTYNYNPCVMALSLGVTYTFYITIDNNVTHFVANQGSVQVWSLDASTGGNYLVLSYSYSGCYDYTDYEEVWQTATSGGSPAFDFYFYNNYWISTDGTRNAATWTPFYTSVPNDVTVVISGDSVLVKNPRERWPMFHHDLTHTGYSTSTAPNTNQTVWNYATGSYVTSSPAVAGGVVYVGSGDNKVYALNAMTGAQVWNYTTGGPVNWASPAVAGGVVYVGSNDGKVYALNAATGIQVWSYTTGSAVYSSPAVPGGVVYVGSTDNKVYALNAATGTRIWSYSTVGPVWSSPAVAGGVVYVGSNDGNVYALDAATGTQVWSYTTGSAVYSSPVVDGGMVFVGSCNNKTYALNASTGAFIWSYTTDSYVFSSPAVADGKVYVGSGNIYEGLGNGAIYCLDASSGAFIWNYTTGGWVESSPAVAGGVVYVGSNDGNVYALDATTGTLVWSYRTGGWVFSSPAVANGIIYVGSLDGEIYAFGKQVNVYLYNPIEPAPMGIADYGIGPSGAYEYATKSFVGIVTVASLLTNRSSNYAATFQLNVDLEFNTSHGLRVYWIQNVAAVTTFGGALRLDDFIDNVWNNTEPFANMSASGISGKGHTGSPGNPYGYSATSAGAFQPSNRTTPTTITLNVTSGVSSSGEPTVSFAYDIGHGLITYDTVTFTNVTGLTSITGFEVNGFNYDPAGYFYDSALILGGQGGGQTTTDVLSNVQLQLEYWNGHNYQIVPNAYNFGSNTGEAIDNVTSGSSHYPGNGKIFAEILPGAGQLGELYNQFQTGAIDIISPLASGTLYVTNASDPNATAWQIPFVSGEVTVTLYPGYYDLQLCNQYGQLFDQGNFTVSAGQTLYLQAPFSRPTTHDIATISAVSAKTVTGFSDNVTVLVVDTGGYAETFNVTAYANSTVIGTKQVSLNATDQTTLTFTWNTTGFAYGNYTISAYAWPVPGETNMANNNCTWSIPVHIGVLGDVSGTTPGVYDGIVSMKDIAYLVSLYQTKPTKPNWNPNADVNNDGVVDMKDIAIAIYYFNQHE